MGLFDFLKPKETPVVPEMVQSVTSASKINLVKEREQKVKISLEKKTTEQIKAKINLAIDVSGSMGFLFRNGKVQEIVERIFPIASAFDDNQELDVWLFENGYRRLPSVTINNFAGYVSKEIISKNYVGGGTSYAPFLSDIFKTDKNSKIPVFNIIITDGDTNDETKSEDVIRKASEYPLFFQFVGIGSEEFSFLQKLDNLDGRKVDNANFFKLNDITAIPDSELYDRLLNEFPTWLKEAKNNNIIK